jgi:hypothetical protein
MEPGQTHPVDPTTLSVPLPPAPLSTATPWFADAYTAWTSAAEEHGLHIGWSSFDYSVLDATAEDDTTCAAVAIGESWYLLRCREATVVAVAVPAPPADADPRR